MATSAKDISWAPKAPEAREPWYVTALNSLDKIPDMETYAEELRGPPNFLNIVEPPDFAESPEAYDAWIAGALPCWEEDSSPDPDEETERIEYKGEDRSNDIDGCSDRLVSPGFALFFPLKGF
jgi:hypothetical protein